MSIREAMNSFLNKMRQGPIVTNDREPNMPNGGHTGYVPKVDPKQAKSQPKQSRQQRPQPQRNSGTQYTGFGGNGYDPNFYGNAGFQQNYNGQPQQPMNGRQGGWQQDMRTSSQPIQQVPPQQVPPQGNWMGPQGQPVGGQNMAAPQVGPVEANAMAPNAPVFRDDYGKTYAHCERLTQPLSVATCFRLIEFMRSGESVLVNLDLVPDKAERARCVDLLAGAAFTMNCTFTRVSVEHLYLIAPSTVLVKPYESMKEMERQGQDRYSWGSTSSVQYT